MGKRGKKKKHLFWLGASAILTLLIYIPSLSNGFVNWDDQIYVYENPLVFDLFGNFSKIMTYPVAGNYHPVTMLSLALDYQLAELSARQYHLTSLLLHLINIGLVYFFVLMISKKNTLIAGISSLLFAIHPMHVESVAWISCRKDLLYCLFFLASLLAYLKYIRVKTFPLLLLSILLFILSCASKPAAVILPIILIMIDYLKKRPFTTKTAIEKLVFFGISIFFGLITISAQKEGGSMGDLETYTILQRVLFAGYGTMMYLFKFLIPVQLTSFYSYPSLKEGLDAAYYLGPVVSLAAVVGLWFLRKNRLALFAGLFFLVNMLLVLQFITVGAAIMADRYTYVSYIGLCVLFAMGLQKLMRKGPLWKKGGRIFLLASALILTVLSFQRTKVWKSGESMWIDVIKKEPISRNYGALGDYYKEKGLYDKGIEMYNYAIQLRPDKADHYGDRGNIYFRKQDYQSAIRDFQKAISMDPDEKLLYRNMGSALGSAGQHQQALQNFNRALQIDPEFEDALIDRGNLLIIMRRYEQALADFQRYLQLNPDFVNFKVYNGMGVCYFYKNDYAQAIAYYDLALRINPKDGQTYNNRSVSYFNMGNRQQALADAETAKSYGFPVDPNYFIQLRGN